MVSCQTARLMEESLYPEGIFIHCLLFLFQIAEADSVKAAIQLAGKRIFIVSDFISICKVASWCRSSRKSGFSRLGNVFDCFSAASQKSSPPLPPRTRRTWTI